MPPVAAVAARRSPSDREHRTSSSEGPSGGGGTPLIRRFAVGPFQSNCYIVGPTAAGRLLVIDPGDESERLAAAVREAGGDVAAILLTHAHLDHVAAVGPLAREFGAPVHLHPDDLPLYERAAEQGRAFGLRFEQPPPPDLELEDEETLVFDDLELEVRLTPGHSPGSVTLVGESDAFVGDAVFAGSIGRTDLPGGDTETLLAAILERIFSLPATTVLHSGHGPETTVAAESATNPFLAHLLEPCLHCGAPLAPRLVGCKDGRCPNCGHPYPHGDCSDT